MVRIRLTRVGRKNTPFFRIGVYEGTVRRDGRSLELLGRYDPTQKESSKKVHLNVEKYRQWIQRGARPTPGIVKILRHAGVLNEAPVTKS